MLLNKNSVIFAIMILNGKENLQPWKSAMFFSIRERVPEIAHLIHLDDEQPSREETERRQVTYEKYRKQITADPPMEPVLAAGATTIVTMETYLTEVKVFKYMKEKHDHIKNAGTRAIAILHSNMTSSALERIKLSPGYKDAINHSDVALLWNIIQASFEDTGGAKARNTAQAVRDLYNKHQLADESIQEYVSKWKQLRQIATTSGMLNQDGKVEAMIFILSLNSDYDLLKNHARNLSVPISGVEDAYTIAVEWMIPKTEQSIEVGAIANIARHGLPKKKLQKQKDNTCHHCGKKGHFKKDCRLYQQSKKDRIMNKINNIASAAAIVLGNDDYSSSDESDC